MEDHSAGILLIYVISVYTLYEFQFVRFGFFPILCFMTVFHFVCLMLLVLKRQGADNMTMPQ